MKKLMAASFMLTACAAPLAANDLRDVCASLADPAPGQWATYRVDGFGNEQFEARYAIVGKESVDGVDHYWFEYEMPMPVGDMSIILKLLVPGFPYTSEDVSRTIVKMPGMPAMDSPAMAASMQRQGGDNLSEPLRRACGATESVESLSVTVRGGTFDAFKVTPGGNFGKDIWLSADVPFGLVKMAEPDGKGLELVAYGSDATSVITEVPVQGF
jgi:hypothetical protein